MAEQNGIKTKIVYDQRGTAWHVGGQWSLDEPIVTVDVGKDNEPKLYEIYDMTGNGAPHLVAWHPGR